MLILSVTRRTSVKDVFLSRVNRLNFVCWSGCHWEDTCEPQARVCTVPEPPGSAEGAGDPVGERGGSGKECIVQSAL